MGMRILFVLAPLGGGHTSAVRALNEACQELAGAQIEVRVLNVFSKLCSRFPLTAIPWLYRLFTVDFPFLWRTLYRITGSAGRFAVAERLAQPFLQPGLQRYLADWQPDIVALAFPALGHSFSRALASVGSTASIVTVVTDLVTVHPAWICAACTAYVVATPEAADACAAAGIPREGIHCLGLPVPGEFLQLCGEGRDKTGSYVGRDELRRILGLDPGLFTLLLMGGGEGGGRLEDIVRALAGSCQACQLVVIAGRNRALQQRLAARRLALPCTVLGYVDNIADWMRASDLLLTKAGGGTVMEAIHCGLPMILTESFPQEAGTVHYLLEHGAARFVANGSEVVATVMELLNRPDRLEALRRNGEGLRRKHAARDIAALILKVAGHTISTADHAGGE